MSFAFSQVPDNNIAVNKPYTLAPRPAYGLTTDADDAIQLTDGRTTRDLVQSTGNPMWFHKEAVGWQNLTVPVTITIDLGGARPIAGVVVHSCHGLAGVTPPFVLLVFVSDDDKTYHHVGDLATDLSPLKPDSGYVERAYRNDNLKTHGRYVRLLVMASGPFLFMDEVEVLGGRDDQIDTPFEPGVTDTLAVFQASKHEMMIRRRLEIDLHRLEQLTGQPAPEELRNAAKNSAMSVEQVVWRNGLPYNDIHRRIWSAIGQARARGTNTVGQLIVQAVDPWDSVQPLEGPSEHPLARLQINVCNGEYRSAAINITNNNEQSAMVEITDDFQTHGFPSELLQVRQAIYVDTKSGNVISAPLADVPKDDGRWRVEVPAGSTRQVWLTVHPQQVKPGAYEITLSLQSREPETNITMPLAMHVFSYTFPAEKPVLSTTMWDYAQAGSWYIHNEQVVPAAVEIMREHFVRNPWAGGWILPWPQVGRELDGEGNFVTEIAPERWAALDQWISLWPDAERFCIFINGQQTFPGTEIKVGTPAFDLAVGGFFKRLMARFAQQGVEGRRVAICFIDEPHNDAQEQLTLAWHHAAGRGDGAYRLFSDPTRLQPKQMLAEFVEALDIICPNAGYALDSGRPKAEDAIQTLQQAAAGKTFWMYECEVPVTGLDPYHYFRLMAWRCFHHGATGQGFWAFGANGHRDSRIGSWDTFTMGVPEAAIVFWDDAGVTTTKYLEAIREGVEDYQLLAELSKAVGSCADVAEAVEAQRILDKWLYRIADHYSAPMNRQLGPARRAQADQARAELLPLLVKLRGLPQ